MIKKLENLQNIKKETNKFDSIHDAKIFISKNLSKYLKNDKPFENILREIIFMSNIDWKDVQQIITKHMPEVKFESKIENKYDKTNIATVIDKIKEDITKTVHKYMTSPEIGFPVDEVDDYTNISIDINDSDVIIYVGAELSYEPLFNLSLELNKIIEKYDKNAYFDMEQPGRLVAYLFNIK